MAKKKAQSNPSIQRLWPVFILSKRFAHHQKVNPKLLELFYAHRDKEQRTPSTAYASRDN